MQIIQIWFLQQIQLKKKKMFRMYFAKKKKSLSTGQKHMNFHMHEKARERFKNILIIANEIKSFKSIEN